jgi:hypothetical protein
MRRALWDAPERYREYNELRKNMAHGGCFTGKDLDCFATILYLTERYSIRKE